MSSPLSMNESDRHKFYDHGSGSISEAFGWVDHPERPLSSLPGTTSDSEAPHSSSAGDDS